MSDARSGKKPPVQPQEGPGPGPGRAAGERGLPGSFPLVLKKLMENTPRDARLGEGKEGGLRAWGRDFIWGRGLMGAGSDRSEVLAKRSAGGGMGSGMTRGLGGEA